MTNRGIVKEVNGEMLTVEFERHEACGDCHACMHGSTDCAKHTVKLRGKANVGDRVVGNTSRYIVRDERWHNHRQRLLLHL